MTHYKQIHAYCRLLDKKIDRGDKNVQKVRPSCAKNQADV